MLLLHRLEFTDTKESLPRIQVLVGWIGADFLYGFVPYVVGPVVVDFTARDSWNNPWLCVSSEDKQTHGIYNERQFS